MTGCARDAARTGALTSAGLLASVFFTGLTIVCTQVSFRLWFTPVPITLQVMAAILSGLVLGRRLGALSQFQYLVLGAIGLPVFSNGNAGPAALLGPTGGYIVGFVAGAYVAGLVFEKLQARSRISAFFAGIAGVAAIYAFGVMWLAVWLGIVRGQGFAACLTGAWQLGIVPFIGVDLLKALAASGLALGGRSVPGLMRAFPRNNE